MELTILLVFVFNSFTYNINDALKTILSIVARITRANKAWQLSRPGGLGQCSGDLSVIISGMCHDPITTRAQFVEMKLRWRFYVQTSTFPKIYF